MFAVWNNVRIPGLLLVLSAVLLFGGTVSHVSFAESRDGEAKKTPAQKFRLQLGDDSLMPPDPIHPRDPAGQARVDATAWYMTGQFRQARNDFRGALDAYRKAVKLDPDAIQIYRALIPLAFSLNQIEEAVKYARKAVELDPSDHRLLRRLAVHMAAQGNLPDAIGLLEKAVQSKTLKKNSGVFVMLMSDLAVYYGATGQALKAADCYRVVFDALVHPDKFKLDFRTRRMLESNPATRFERIGQAFLDAKRPKQAVDAFERAAKARKGKPGTLSYNLARVYLQTNQRDKALSELQKYFDAQLQSKGSTAYELLADILKQMGKSGELIGRLEELAKKDLRNSTLQYFLAGQYVARNRLKEAEALYKKTLAGSGDAEGYAGLAVVYRRQNQPEKLLDALSKALTDVVDALLLARMRGQRDSENPHLKRFEAEMKPLRENEKLLDGLLAAGRKLAQGENPQLEFAGSYILATLAAEARNSDAAVQFFRFAIKARRERAQPIYEELGGHLLIVRNYAEAVNVFREAVNDPALAGSKPNNLLRLSQALEWNRETKAALEAIQQARKIVAGNAAGKALLDYQEGWIYYHSRQWDKAVPVFEQIIAKSQQAKGIARQSQFHLSNIYVQQGDIRKGEQILEKILAEEPDNPSVNNDLGYLYADQGKHLEKAETMIRKAIKAEPENPAYLDSMGWVLYKLGKFDEAVTYLEKAIKTPGGDDPTILDHLADCYDHLQKTHKAKELWQKALEKSKAESRPDKKLIEQIEQKLKKAKSAGKPRAER